MSIATTTYSRPGALLALLAGALVPAAVWAKPVLLMQQGISLYEDVAKAIVAQLPGVEVLNLDDVAGAAELAKAVDASSPEVVLVVGVAAARMASAAKLRRPVVFCLVPQGERDALRELDGTGVSLEVAHEEQLAAVREVLPAVKRLGVIYDPKFSKGLLAEARAAAKGAGMQLVEKAVGSAGDIPGALQAISGDIDAVWMLQDRTVGTAIGFKVLLVGTLDRRLPLITYSGTFVESGALLSLSPDFTQMASEAVRLAQKIVAGAAPKTIPWQNGPGQLVINGRIASRLGVTIPGPVSARAKVVN